MRILYINGGIMARGGTESFMMNNYRLFDHSKLQVDFIVHGFEKGYYDDEIISLGGKIYNIPSKTENYKQNVIQFKQILSTNKYKIIHSHMNAMSYIPLRIAKNLNVPIRIAHSHSTNHQTNNPIKILLNEYARLAVRKYATHMFACSKMAGDWLFGSREFKIVNNAIDIDQYSFDQEKRDKLRLKLGLNKKFVLGHVGRFTEEKNHKFIISVFSEIAKRKENSVLLLIGEGPLMPRIKKEVIDNNLESKVIFLGSRSDISSLLNALDVFVFPSIFEGLGFSVIEAQANGLPIFLSNTIPQEVDIVRRLNFLPIKNPQYWADTILSSDIERKINIKEYFVRSGYDLEKEASRLQDFYLKISKMEY